MDPCTGGEDQVTGYGFKLLHFEQMAKDILQLIVFIGQWTQDSLAFCRFYAKVVNRLYCLVFYQYI